MPLDIVSYLMGQKSGGGGGATQTPQMVGVAGYIGTMELGSNRELAFSIQGASGMFAAVLCWTRGQVTPPAGGVLIYEKQRDLGGYVNVISLVKVPITTDDFTVRVSNPTENRSGAACFVIDRDFTCTALKETNNLSDTVTWPKGFSVFCSLSGIVHVGAGRLENDTYPVCYMWPTDVSNTGQYFDIRALAGFITAAHEGTANIGSTSSDNDGLFVCLHLVTVE